MLDNIKLGQYLQGDSWFYRLDPRIKIIGTFTFIVIIFLAKDWTYGIITLFSLIVILTSGISLKFFYRSIRPIFFLMLFTFVLNLFFIKEGDVLVTIFDVVKIHEGALTRGAQIILRLILIVSFTSLLTFTTKPTDLTVGLESVFSPLKIIKFPAAELALMISISLRFIPTLLEETQKIMKAQTSRGADFTDGKLKEKVLQIVSLLVPMFIISFKRAEDLANAMEARGYIPGKERTRLNQLKLKLRDYLYLTSFLVVTALLVLYRLEFGW
ncbi:energy-coupling factor transporter transmembrane component T family protein [Haloplasma contractile]|uniref:Energy-coupling factor transporter transmembrane protein EcfT n=1 Tax=Haloplasma contractile SSD-17B TaxID=1033810 RepID=U2EC39_9MOLU|nr:energy-coupling factor transporter transmembrane component T [Haloplasma contractile]ERJ12356.1 Energy-coupling factor transporter transmembrane protein EcfT [Haloplasma contractile SSD-17B]